jgi:DNA-binding transcriptional LysR family regulator
VDRSVQETRQIEQANSGRLRIGFVDMAFYSEVMPEKIRQFREQNPRCQVELVPGTSAAQTQWLDAGEIDLALIYQKPAANYNLSCRKLCTEPLAVAVHQDHPFARRSSLNLPELRNEPFVWFDRMQNSPLFDHVDEVCGRSGLRRRIIQDGANDPTQLTLVAAQVGITFSPVSANFTKPPKVRLIGLQNEPLQISLYAAWRRDQPVPPIVNDLLSATCDASRQ